MYRAIQFSGQRHSVASLNSPWTYFTDRATNKSCIQQITLLSSHRYVQQMRLKPRYSPLGPSWKTSMAKQPRQERGRQWQ